jgi:hypothetical protein
MSAYLSVAVALIGLFFYIYFSRPAPPPPPAVPNASKFAECGKIAYAFGLFAFLLASGNILVSIVAIKGALSIALCVLGFVVYLLSRSDPWAEVGRLTYAMSGLAFLIALGTQVVSMLPGK